MIGTGTSRGTRGAIGVTPTGIEIGIDIKIAQLGVSTDYGGGIVVGIAGQKIVFGREGGKIHYQFAGLEVLVEARECIIVKTKKIAGHVVSRHTYPDPGCKPEPEPPDPALPQPIADPEIENAIELPNSEEIGWVPFSEISYGYSWLTLGLVQTIKVTRTATDIEVTPYSANYHLSIPYTSQNKTTHDFFWEAPVVPKGSHLSTSNIFTFRADEEGTVSHPVLIYYSNYYQWSRVCFYGSATSIKNFINEFNAETEKHIRNFGQITHSPGFGVVRFLKLVPTGFIPVKAKVPLPLGGNKPAMPDSCCEQILADLADFKDVIAVKEILAGKLTFPWGPRMPGGQGEEVIKDYPSLLRAISQMIDHLGIHPPKLSIKDINNAIAGDQSLSNQFPSATQGFEALMAQVWDANADTDTLTNFLYRLSWLCVQQSMNIAVLSGKVQSILDMIGGATEPSESSITTPFNIGAGVDKKATKGQGFGKGKIDKKIDVNTEIATESLLPDFLKIRENPIIIENFSGEQDVFDKLTIIMMKLETIQNSLRG